MAPPEPTCCFAAAQFEPVPGDLPRNLDRHLALAHLAASGGADLVVFPELSLTGYELEGFGERALERGATVLEPLREAAARHGMTIVAGAPLREHGRLHLASFVWTAHGAEQLYTKRNLGAFTAADTKGRPVPPSETLVAQPGTLDPLISVQEESMALAICADIGCPEHARNASRRGATVYAASVFAIEADVERDVARLEQRSARHSLVVVMANFCGHSGGLPAGGRSRVIAHGETVVALGAGESGLAMWGPGGGRTLRA